MKIHSNTAIINCEIYGARHPETLVLLHGNGEDSTIFKAQIDYFSQFYKVVAVDTRAHGKSTRGQGKLTYQLFAQDLLNVFNELKIEKAHILGFSDGAITAMYFALIAQERIQSLILLGGNYTPKGLKPKPRKQIQKAYCKLLFQSIYSSKARKTREVWALMVFQPYLKLSEIATIKVPTLVVTGERDMVSQQENDDIHNAIAGSQRLIIPNGNHFLAFKMPDVFNMHVMDFLKNSSM